MELPNPKLRKIYGVEALLIVVIHTTIASRLGEGEIIPHHVVRLNDDIDNGGGRVPFFDCV